MDNADPTQFDLRLRATVAAFSASSSAESAQALADAHIPVFPCVPGAKRPLTRHGFRDATTDLAQVIRWWERQPDANVAIPTGRASGWDVVDVDVHDDASGRQTFDASRDRGLTTGWAFTVATPSGGLHAYYPNVGEQSCWATDAHIDFRSDGGYVVVPPSAVGYDDGRASPYRLAATASHQPAPVDGAVLRDFVSPPRPPRPVAYHGTGTASSDPARLADWLAAHPENGRKRRLFWAACRVVEAGHDLDTALATIGNAALRIGLTGPYTEGVIRSAFRHTHPRAAPRRTPWPPSDQSPGDRRRPSLPEVVSL